MTKYLNYQETADMLSLKSGTLYSLVSRKQIPHVRISNRMVRFKEEEILRWLGEKEVAVSAVNEQHEPFSKAEIRGASDAK